MKIDLELFRTFKAVFEIGTISGAARVLVGFEGGNARRG